MISTLTLGLERAHEFNIYLLILFGLFSEYQCTNHLYKTLNVILKSSHSNSIYYL